jgi:DNA adenine methylase
MMQMRLFDDIVKQKPVNVATVPMRSPFRYPGGKTWFVPYIRKWLKSYDSRIDFFEPFAGGGIASLTVGFENLARGIVMVEKDEDVASVWWTVLGPEYKWLAEQIINFQVTPREVNRVISSKPNSTRARAFQTVLRNRIQHGGILAPGAGLIKNGENGKGLKSRWYPETLKKRICSIHDIRSKIDFIEGDGIDVIARNSHRRDAVFFIDPPYTIAGRRLYKYYQTDHEGLFAAVDKVAGDFVMTYDDAEEIEMLAECYGFCVKRVIMKTTHHCTKYELVIGRDLAWVDQCS